jgi:hypothetical protein
MVRVLQIAAGHADAQQRIDQVAGRHAVAGLGVDGDRNVDRSRDPSCCSQHLVGRRALVILVPEGCGDAGARGGDDREARGHHCLRRRHVPRVRQHERCSGDVE